MSSESIFAVFYTNSAGVKRFKVRIGSNYVWVDVKSINGEVESLVESTLPFDPNKFRNLSKSLVFTAIRDRQTLIDMMKVEML